MRLPFRSHRQDSSAGTFLAVGVFVLGMGALWSLQGCAPIEAPSNGDGGDASGPIVASGDIVVSNSGSDVVLALNPDGTYKGIVFDVENTSETVYGIAWDADTEEILVAVDGADRVIAVAAADGTTRDVITNVNLTGNLRGIAKLVGGDILVVETNNIERFTSAGIRVATGGWPKTLQTTGTGLDPTASGGFVHCSTGTDVVRVYDSNGTQTNTVSSGIAGTTDAAGCKVLANGNVAAIWNGTTDTVRIYDSTLATTVASYSDTAILGSPQDVAERANGNLVVIDNVFHHMVEIESDGTYVGVLGGAVLNTPMHVLIVP